MDRVTRAGLPADSISTSSTGFTLLELMVAIALGGMVMTALLASFLSQCQVYHTQDLVVEMQQNARVAMDMLEQDIRSAGFDPKHHGAGITVAEANMFAFIRDNDDGRLETIRYALIDAFASVGHNDGVVDDLGRSVDGGGLQPIAENISQLEFRYLDENGIPTIELRNICFVQVSILVQSAERETKTHLVRDLYVTPSGVQWQAQGGFRNLYLTTTLNGRNLGL